MKNNLSSLSLVLAALSVLYRFGCSVTPSLSGSNSRGGVFRGQGERRRRSVIKRDSLIGGRWRIGERRKLKWERGKMLLRERELGTGRKKKEETLCAKSKSCNMRSIYLCYGASRDSRQLHRCSQPYPRPKDATERQKKKIQPNKQR